MAEDDKSKTLMQEIYDFIKELYLEEEDKKIELREKYIKNKFSINRFKREQMQYEKVNDTNIGFFNPNTNMLNEKIENIKQEIEKLSMEQIEEKKKLQVVEKRMDKISILRSLLAEKEEQEHQEKERLEKEEKERQEKERLEKEEKERQEKERIEKEEKERQEKERLEKEEKERQEKERLEKEEKECQEKERLEKEEKERQEKERLEKEEKERQEKERLEKEEKECQEKEEEEFENNIQEWEHHSTQSILKTYETERQRIAQDLHDTTVQNLTGLIHKTEYCLLLTDKDPVKVKLELAAMQEVLKSTIDEMRNIIYNLRPMSIDDLGLVETVNKYIKQLENENEEITFDISTKNEEKKLDSMVGLAIFRIIQEACNNTIKHGNASLLFISIEYKENTVEVSVEDDGIGFNKEKIMEKKEKNKGFGLSIMKERAELISGVLDIQSEEEKGTSIKLIVPIA